LAANGSVTHVGASEASPPLALAPASQRTTTLNGRRAPGDRPAHRDRLWGSRTRLLWPAVAAALALVIGGGTLTAAAHALPGSPLFGVRKLEQNVQISLASSAADRVRLHLAYASDALAALDAVVAGHGGDPAYADALNALREEDQAAASGVAELPSGSERDSLAAQVDALRSRERQDLRAALPTLGWPDRIATTDALGQADDTVPTVTSTTIGRGVSGNGGGGESDGHRWQVIVQGTGFQPGAVLLVNGVPAGTVTNVSPTELQAEVSAAGAGSFAGSIGIGNPDGTAAVTTQISQPDRGPGPQATTTPGHDHGTGGGGDGHGGHAGTPTPGAGG
jgi:hypothetical protein